MRCRLGDRVTPIAIAGEVGLLMVPKDGGRNRGYSQIFLPKGLEPRG